MAPPKRKLIGFDPETWQALKLLSRDSGNALQELADEAFADLLVEESARREPANENRPPKRRG